MKLLGLDYGDRRIGVAVCDETGRFARGLATVVRRNRERDLEAIAAYARQEEAAGIVIGYPLMLDGSEGVQCEKVKRFIAILEKNLRLPVYRWDETLSSREAETFLAAPGRGRRRREDIDRVAASVILQGYLDARNRDGGTAA